MSQFIQKYDYLRHTNLTSEQDVLTSLGHRTVISRNNKDSAVHLGCTSNHIFDIVSMARAVNMCIMAVIGLIFDMSRLQW